MELRALGSTGIVVSVIGLGAVKLGRNRGLRHGAFELPTDAQAGELLATARELGINLIDTAPAYGVSEERLGALLAGRRDEWVICTKAGEEFDGERSAFDFSAGAVRASVERSLRRLRTDRLDIVLLHSDGNDEAVIARSGAVGALEALKREGKVRAIGASTKTVEGAMLGVRTMDVVMLSLNPAYPAEGVAAVEAGRLGKGVLVKKALAGGSLGEIRAARAEGDPVEESLRFVFGHAGVTSVVLGTLSPAHLRHNAACAERALRGG